MLELCDMMPEVYYEAISQLFEIVQQDGWLTR